MSRSHYKLSVGLPTYHLRWVILLLCLLRHTSRRLGLPLLIQSYGSHDYSTLPLFYHRYFEDSPCHIFTRPNITYTVQQVCLYMHDPREPHLWARSTSSNTSKTPSTTPCFATPLRQTSSSTLKLTRLIVLTLINPLRAMWCFYATTSSHGPQSVRTLSLIQALRRSTTLWPMTWQTCVGFINWLRSYSTPYRGPL
jgi:hypothetical protein